MKTEELIEYHQKRIRILTTIIEGHFAIAKWYELELKNVNPENSKDINWLLDSSSKVKKVKEVIEDYSRYYAESETFLEKAGVEIDYSWLPMTRQQWEETLQWEKKWVEPYIKKRTSIIQIFKSFIKIIIIVCCTLQT